MLTHNEIIINGGVHKFCESHSVFYSAHFTSDQCPMCVNETHNKKIVTDLESELGTIALDYHDQSSIVVKLKDIK